MVGGTTRVVGGVMTRKATRKTYNAKNHIGCHFNISSNLSWGNIQHIAHHQSSHVIGSGGKVQAIAYFSWEAVYIWQILEEMGHMQQQMIIQRDTLTAAKMICNKMQPKHTTPMI